MSEEMSKPMRSQSGSDGFGLKTLQLIVLLLVPIGAASAIEAWAS